PPWCSSTPGWVSLPTVFLRVGYFDLGYVVSWREPEHMPEERKFSERRMLNCFRRPEAVSLVLVLDVRYWQALASNGFGHRGCLVGRHNLVPEPLQQQHRTIQAIYMMDRRALNVRLFFGRIGPDESIKVATLELVRIGCQ